MQFQTKLSAKECIHKKNIRSNLNQIITPEWINSITTVNIYISAIYKKYETNVTGIYALV